MTDFARARLTMVDTQLRPNDIVDQPLLAAMLAVPREAFVDEARKSLAYLDTDIPLDADDAPGRFLIEPMIFAKLVQLAELRSTDTVLEVGTGTGYGAAVLARLAASVVALEESEALAGRARTILASVEGAGGVTVVTGPLTEGAAKQAPFNVILIAGAVAAVPQALLGQLAEGGRLVAVVGEGRAAKGTVFRRDGGRIVSRIAFDAAIPALRAFAVAKEFVF